MDPTVGQDAKAAQVLRALVRGRVADPDPGVYTGHLLVNKRYGFWTPDVRVSPLPDVYADRNELFAALERAVADHAIAQPDVPVVGGYTFHTLPAAGGSWRAPYNRSWQTTWAPPVDDIGARYDPDRPDREPPTMT